jgi:hypothetical protein
VLHASPISFFSISLIRPGPRLVHMFRNIILFYVEDWLTPRPTPTLEDHPLSAVRNSLFDVFAATLHNWRPFLHPQTDDAPAVVTGTHLTRVKLIRIRN